MPELLERPTKQKVVNQLKNFEFDANFRFDDEPAEPVDWAADYHFGLSSNTDNIRRKEIERFLKENNLFDRVKITYQAANVCYPAGVPWLTICGQKKYITGDKIYPELKKLKANVEAYDKYAETVNEHVAELVAVG